MSKDVDFKNLYGVIFHYVHEGRKGTSPMLQKAGDNLQHLLLWRSKEAVLQYLKDHQIAMEGCEVVSADHFAITNYLESAKNFNRKTEILVKD